MIKKGNKKGLNRNKKSLAKISNLKILQFNEFVKFEVLYGC